MSEPIDDKAFEEYLQRQSQVSRQYRSLEGGEVPPELDRRVLAQAAHAVEKKPPGKSARWKTWSVPVALAASTVLTVAVVIESGLEPKPVMRPTEVGVQSRSPAPPRAPTQADRAESLAFESPPPADAFEMPAPQAPVAEIAEPKAEPRPLADRAQSNASAETRAAPAVKSVEQARAAERVETPAPTSSAPASSAEPARPQGLAVPPATAISQVASQRPFVPPSRSQTDAVREEAAKTAGESASGSDHDLSEIMVTGNRRQDRAIIGPRGTLMRRGPAGEADAEPADAEERRREEDPVRWLEFIRELRRDGKTQEADRQWGEFRKAYPEYEVAEADSARPQR